MNARSIAMAVVLILLVAAGLWGIWVFESRSAARASSGAEEFSFQLTRSTTGDSDIMLLCPEDILTEPGEAFSKWLKLNGSSLTIPGGVMMLARLNDVSIDESMKPLQRSAVEILKRYSPRRVVLVAHTFCIYYDTLAAWNNNLANVRQREVADLQAAIHVLQQWFPKAEVTGYLAEEDPSHRLVFHASDRLMQ